MSTARELLRLALQRVLRAGSPYPKRSLFILVIGLVGISAWQARLASAPERLDATYRVTASHGAHQESRFFFFRYHLGLYPLASELPASEDTKAEAERLLQSTAPEKLYQEEGLTFRSGDHGRIHLFYIDKLLGGDTRKPSLISANRLAFILALDCLFFAAWWIDFTGLGLLLVLVFGSNPLQLYAAYAQENYFSWPITAMILALALHLPLLRPAPSSRTYLLIAPVVTGLLLAGIRTWRSEPASLLASAVMTYVLAYGVSRRRKLAAVLLLVSCFSLGNKAYERAILAKIERTKQVLHERNVPTYDGPTIFHHEFWHPMWCGLGDFDTSHGYTWEDRKAYQFALPLLEQRAGRKLPLDPTRWMQQELLGQSPRYHAIFSDTSGYHEVLRDKILSDIRREPLWYVRILWKRVSRILSEGTPIRLELGSAGNPPSVTANAKTSSQPSSLFGWLAIPLGIALWRVRRGFYTKLLLFTLPLCIPAILVYSGGGMHLYSCLHLVSAALVAWIVFEGFASRLRRGRLLEVGE
jgi:hypothetical protein